MGDGVRRVGVEEVGVGGSGSGVLRSVKLGSGVEVGGLGSEGLELRGGWGRGCWA